jgi:predicted metal-dependent enzyme (double-stranded beta helix superfamily)
VSNDIAPLSEFLLAFGRLLDTQPDEGGIARDGGALLRRLVSRDGWLPEAFALPDPVHYRQYLLHLDPAERFSVVSFVWGPGQSPPVHDHTVWGLVGVLRGAEYAQGYTLHDGASPQPQGAEQRLEAGEVEAVSPTLGDVHRVRNAFDDRVSVSIHVYGANIGAIARHTYPPGGGRKAFVSGYANALPSTHPAPP